MEHITVASIKKKKGVEKIAMITAYDALFARLFDPLIDIILVGDSLSMSFGGARDTLGITLDAMIYHTQAVCKASTRALVILDMPFGSCSTPEETLRNATRVYKESGAEAIKLEGGIEKAPSVALLVENGIAVMAHIGLKPQFVRAEGGYKIKGKTEEEKESLLRDAKALEEAGAFSILLEGVKAEVARSIAEQVSIPVIGIGSGAGVDGQVLVWSDLLGFEEQMKPKFVRTYAKGATWIREGVRGYVDDVRSGAFPDETESY